MNYEHWNFGPIFAEEKYLFCCELAKIKVFHLDFSENLKKTNKKNDFTQYLLLITFANSLDLDQARQNVRLIWIQNQTQIIFPKEFLKRLSLKNSEDDKRACKITQHANS